MYQLTKIFDFKLKTKKKKKIKLIILKWLYKVESVKLRVELINKC